MINTSKMSNPELFEKDSIQRVNGPIPTIPIYYHRIKIIDTRELILKKLEDFENE
jgi:hypothetical protein